MVAVLDVGITARHAGRAKFAHGESHMTEHGARIVLAGLNAFLIRNTILGCLDEILSGTNDANDREDAKRYGQIAPSFPVAQRTAQAIANGLGNVTAATATMTFMLLFANSGTQNNRIDDLRYRDVIDK